MLERSAELRRPRHPRHPDRQHRRDHDRDRSPARASQAQDVLDGKLDYMQDPPPADLEPTILEQARRPLRRAPDRRHLLLLPRPAARRRSTTRSSARRSTAAIDRAALARALRRGDGARLRAARPRRPRLRRAPRHHRLPVRRSAEPPDLGRARALIHQAGAEGEPVTVWGSGAADSRAATEAYAATLQQIGLDAGRGWSRRTATTRRSTTGAPGADRVRHLVRGLPASARLLRRRRRRLDPADQQPEPRRRRRSARQRRDRPAASVDDLDSVVADWSRLDALRGLAAAELRRAARATRQVATFFSERMDPDERDLPSRLPQRLLELAAEGGRVGPIRLIRANGKAAGKRLVNRASNAYPRSASVFRADERAGWTEAGGALGGRRISRGSPDARRRGRRAHRDRCRRRAAAHPVAAVLAAVRRGQAGARRRSSSSSC